MSTLTWIGALGIVGVFTRYFCGMGFGLIRLGGFPLPTMVINVAGSLLAGVLYVLGTERQWISADVRIGLMVGFLGGFTTFSSYSLEGFKLLEEGSYLLGLVYLIGSPVLGALAAGLGIWLGRLWT